MKNERVPELSIVVPVYNESEGINEFHRLLSSTLNTLSISSWEIIYINDGSKDDSLKKLHKFAKKSENIKILSFSRNFGKEVATSAGIEASSGLATIIMDSDGQHPPSLITTFIDKWKDGAQVVIGIRSSNQKEGLIKKYGSYLFYKFFNYTSGAKIIPRSTDFRLIDKDVRDEFVKFSERHRITRGLIDWLGFDRQYIHFDSPARLAGEASYKTSQLIRLAFNSFISLSLKPLFFFGWIGLFITIVSLLMGAFVFVEQYLLGDPMTLNITGSGLLGILMSFLVGLVLISQAVLATYVSHIHSQTQARPMYIVDKSKSVNL